MAFRNRPVLDRKHRPRWQDELRMQQLLVAGFAVAIAIAIGIFAAAAWSSFFESNLRQSALVGGVPVDRSAVLTRVNIQAAELQAKGSDLASLTGGMTGDRYSQQLQGIQTALNQVPQSGADSLVTGMVLDRRAADYGLSVTPAAIDAEVDKRMHLPERRQLSIIMASPKKPKGARDSDKPTDAAWAEAKQRIDDLKSQVDAGGDFAALAKDQSDDGSKSKDGSLGWVQADDPNYADYFTTAAKAQTGDVLGPFRNDAGWYILKVDGIRQATENATLRDLLTASGVSDAAYRDFVRQELLRDQYQHYFETKVVTEFEPQRKVAQIVITKDAPGSPGTKLRLRHVLVAPLPGEPDQSKATAKQWRAALVRARALHAELVKPGANWWELAKQSDDPGTATRGGALGWADPGTLNQQFVPEFARAVLRMAVGDTSEPVKSQFGYHIIQVVDRRTSVQSFADDLAAKLQKDPDGFADMARDLSDDFATAGAGGELGWVLHYQLANAADDAIFGLAKPGDVSEAVATKGEYTIYKLEEAADDRYATRTARNKAKAGFGNWLDKLKQDVGYWLDAEFLPTTTAVG
jgi:parvulin-like peptidyl-prolyl isomerase